MIQNNIHPRVRYHTYSNRFTSGSSKGESLFASFAVSVGFISSCNGLTPLIVPLPLKISLAEFRRMGVAGADCITGARPSVGLVNIARSVS